MTQVKTILLIDDDDDLREALTEQFVMTEEFAVVEAGTGADALQHLKKGLFDRHSAGNKEQDTQCRKDCSLGLN